MSKLLEGNGNGNGANGLLGQPKKPAPQPSATMPLPKAGESLVAFQTHDGVKVRGVPAQVTRHRVVFEVFSLGAILRLSETLDNFSIVLQGRTVYSGRAVVSNVVDASAKIVCEVSLDEVHWTDLNQILALQKEGQVAREFKFFLKDWQNLYKVLPEYKIALIDMLTFLTDLRIWLDQVDLSIRGAPLGNQSALEQETAQLLAKVVPVIWSFFERFENAASRIDADLVATHYAFGKRLLHPLLLNSPFVSRTFCKPSGYAGDYEMVSMMFRQPFEGATLFAKAINLYALQLPPVVAHRNRIKYLARQIELEAVRVAHTGRTARIFNFACGPAIEVQRFIGESPLNGQAAFRLVDFDTEALNHAELAINHIIRRGRAETQVQFERQSVQQLIKESRKQIGPGNKERPGYDFIYCAGLFDYLPDNTCRLLLDIFFRMLAPGGLLLATNVDNHSARYEAECFLEWHLVQRNTAQMRTLAPSNVAVDDIVLKSDSTGVNIFMEIRKPGCEK